MGTLNVILHGLFALVERKECILALAPDLDGDHVFRAGNWLGETQLQRGFYTLDGVTAGNSKFDTDRNLVLTKKTMRFDAVNRAHAAILLPTPEEIFSVRPIEVAQGDFTGADAGSAGPKMATIQILVYSAEDLAKVTLTGHNWEPPDEIGDSLNLHIFSEEERKPDNAQHPVSSFEQSLQLFDRVDLKLVNAKVVPELDLSEVLPPGVCRQEVEDMGHRITRMTILGTRLPEALRTRDFSDLINEVWPDGEPTAGRLTSCSFPIVRSDQP